MRQTVTAVAVSFHLFAVSLTYGATLLVPTDYPTITTHRILITVISTVTATRTTIFW